MLIILPRYAIPAKVVDFILVTEPQPAKVEVILPVEGPTGSSIYICVLPL